MQFLTQLKLHFNTLMVLPSFWFIFGLYHAFSFVVVFIRFELVSAVLNAVLSALAYFAFWLSKKYQAGKGE